MSVKKSHINNKVQFLCSNPWLFVAILVGSEGLLLVPFHSNPGPLNISWYISGVGHLEENSTAGRFTAEGWEEFVRKNVEKE